MLLLLVLSLSLALSLIILYDGNFNLGGVLRTPTIAEPTDGKQTVHQQLGTQDKADAYHALHVDTIS